MDILFLSRWYPFPPDNGSKLRIYQLLMGLSKAHRVTLLSFIDPLSFNMKPLEQFENISIINVVPWQTYKPESLRSKIGFFNAAPRFLVDTYSSQMETLIRNTIARHNYDLVIASELSMASYYSCFEHLPALFEDIELGPFYDQMQMAGSLIKRLRLSLTWYKLRNYFSRLLTSFQSCTVPSERERWLFTNSFPKHEEKIEVIPNCINVKDYESVQIGLKPNYLVFSGSFQFQANYEAMNWFVREVYPKVLERMPAVHLVITGDHANLPLPNAKNIILAGYVNDIKSLIASCSVSIAPLQSGGGTRLKILEAMALGTPVVATSKGAEGIDAINGDDLLIADDPNSFAECVLSILQNNDLRSHLAMNAHRLVAEKYNWEKTMPCFLQLVEYIGQHR